MHTTANFNNGENLSSSNHKDVWNHICPELKNAIDSGKWMRSDPDSCQLSSPSSFSTSLMEVDDDNVNSSKERRRGIENVSRPLKSLNVPSCGFRMQVMMDV